MPSNVAFHVHIRRQAQSLLSNEAMDHVEQNWYTWYELNRIIRTRTLQKLSQIRSTTAVVRRTYNTWYVVFSFPLKRIPDTGYHILVYVKQPMRYSPSNSQSLLFVFSTK